MSAQESTESNWWVFPEISFGRIGTSDWWMGTYGIDGFLGTGRLGSVIVPSDFEAQLAVSWTGIYDARGTPDDFVTTHTDSFNVLFGFGGLATGASHLWIPFHIDGLLSSVPSADAVELNGGILYNTEGAVIAERGIELYGNLYGGTWDDQGYAGAEARASFIIPAASFLTFEPSLYAMAPLSPDYPLSRLPVLTGSPMAERRQLNGAVDGREQVVANCASINLATRFDLGAVYSGVSQKTDENGALLSESREQWRIVLGVSVYGMVRNMGRSDLESAWKPSGGMGLSLFLQTYVDGVLASRDVSLQLFTDFTNVLEPGKWCLMLVRVDNPVHTPTWM